MPHHLLKTERHADAYLVWSTITDAPLAAGSREGLQASYRHPDGSQLADAWFETADWYGSSDGKNGFGCWEATGLDLREVFPTARWIPRDALPYLAQAMLQPSDLTWRIVQSMILAYDPDGGYDRHLDAILSRHTVNRDN
ncbi:hypothetical protein ABZ470_39980 [Streptosporangium sp. NPDC020072]|uniref:hypothetical protein n=1 Tax=Streptosporangium sp. NPDC020072 TaxID=3154788 RepID=UPI00341A67F2